MTGRFLIFSLALNGYQRIYNEHLASHRAYAEKIGAQYVVVTRPYISNVGVECCWLKLYLLVTALKNGYDHVLVLDADTMINDRAPDIRCNLTPGKHLYMAKSYTKRFNSGVLLADNHPTAVAFIRNVILNRNMQLPESDDVGWGENGHIIHFSKATNIIQEIPGCWNNTFSCQENDYIRHYNHGPFRRKRFSLMTHKMISLTSRVVRKVHNIKNGRLAGDFSTSLFEKELVTILNLYPQFERFPSSSQKCGVC